MSQAQKADIMDISSDGFMHGTVECSVAHLVGLFLGFLVFSKWSIRRWFMTGWISLP